MTVGELVTPVFLSLTSSTMASNLSVRRVLILAAVFIGLFAIWSRSLSEAPITADALHNLSMGVNLAHHGVISGNTTGPIEPTMYREPLPAVSTAINVVIVDAVMGKAELSAYSSGPRAKYLKYQNLFWAATMTLAFLGLLLFLTNSFPLSLLGAVIVNLPIPGLNRPDIDTLLTEPVAGSLLAISALMMAWWARRESRILLFFAGLAFGLLALTKAIFLYVFIGILIILPLVQVIFGDSKSMQLRRKDARNLTTNMVLFAAAFSAVTVPWMWRNYVQLDNFGISERAGVILMQRAVLNQMTNEEYLGAFYVFAPNKPIKSLVAVTSGFAPNDLQRGGRLQRLSHGEASGFSEEDLAAELEGRPEDAISYYRRARAWRIKLTNEYRAADHVRPLAMADKELKSRALAMIRETPWQHASFIVLAVWRGALASTPILLIALIYALWSKRKDIAVTVLPSLGMIALYALATPFEARMGKTVMPLAVAMALALLAAGWSRLRTRLNPIPQSES